ncbi:MAG: sialate O-acetylesterase [Chitinophagaceae bacterium]|nr:MAG: sialate O-acetylesterase [Chitinophagaceae bacterium]
MTRVRYMLVFCLLAVSMQCFSALKLADALQNNMVLQQNKTFKIWGKANAGDQINILADWMSNPVRVVANNDGDFLGIIDIPLAKKGDFTPHQIIVKSQKVISQANQPNIRLLSVGLNFSATPIGAFSGKWQECSADKVKDFSAVGYTFGRKLYDELDIPIGLIFSGIGASGVQAYIPQEELENNKLLNDTYLKPYLESPKSKEKIDGGFSFEKVVRPYLLYNALISPFTNLSIKGFCWYQGEANHMERESYVAATKTMITSWRNNFKQGDLPFYYVQIAPYFHEKEDDKLAYDAFFREAQEKIAGLNNTAMVSIMDVGDAKDLHPKNKKPIGLRLAATALNRVYAQHNVIYQSPKYNYVTFEKSNATIHFVEETLGTGLNTNDGATPKFFYIAGEDQVFYPATATINSNTIMLLSTKVKQPKAVRYAFFNYPITNLQNKEGFPVLPFRTDSWPETK